MWQASSHHYVCYYKEAKIITWKTSPKIKRIKVGICLTLAYQIAVFWTKKTIQYLVTKSRYVFDVHHEMDAEFNMHTHFHFTGQLQVHNPK